MSGLLDWITGVDPDAEQERSDKLDQQLRDWNDSRRNKLGDFVSSDDDNATDDAPDPEPVNDSFSVTGETGTVFGINPLFLMIGIALWLLFRK